MLNLERIKMDYCVEQLSRAYRRTYSDMEQELGNVIIWSSHLALEIIANSDALYHNVEHTVMVTLAGTSILEGKHLSEGGVSPSDWAHFVIALLCHDIGFVKGICKDDIGGTVSTGVDGQTAAVTPGGTDAALAPYHVDRSKMFVQNRFGTGMLAKGLIDAGLLTSYIEMTRFPVPDGEMHKNTNGYQGLVRAADLIGQLGDPYRIQKCTALFYEFEELGLNKQLGYKTPGDLRKNHAKFYWSHVNKYIQEAVRYLRVTQTGKQWIANMQANVFSSDYGFGDLNSLGMPKRA